MKQELKDLDEHISAAILEQSGFGLAELGAEVTAAVGAGEPPSEAQLEQVLEQSSMSSPYPSPSPVPSMTSSPKPVEIDFDPEKLDSQKWQLKFPHGWVVKTVETTTPKTTLDLDSDDDVLVEDSQEPPQKAENTSVYLSKPAVAEPAHEDVPWPNETIGQNQIGLLYFCKNFTNVGNPNQDIQWVKLETQLMIEALVSHTLGCLNSNRGVGQPS